MPTGTDQPTSPANESRVGSQPRGISPTTAMSQSEAKARSRNMPAPTAIPPHMQNPGQRPGRQSQNSPEPTTAREASSRASPESMTIPHSAHQEATMPRSQSTGTVVGQQAPNRSFATPLMESPDMRPPSDDYLPDQSYGQTPLYSPQNENAPSMPNLTIPSPDQTGLSNNKADDRPARPRTPSSDENTTPRPRQPSPTPVNSHKRSVSFNPRLDFNEAPKNRTQHNSDSEDDSSNIASRKRRDRERDRDKGRDRDPQEKSRDKHRRGYDAGDDFSDDTPLEDHRRRSRDNDRDRKSSRRERTDTQSLDRDQDRDRDQDDRPKRSSTMGGSSSSHHSRRGRDRDSDSDSIEDLPPRFDERGRKKSATSDQELLAQSLDQILGGLLGGSKRKK